MTAPANPIDAFIARWQSAGGSERANYQLFITELCELLELSKPHPAQADSRDNAYVLHLWPWRRLCMRLGLLVAPTTARKPNSRAAGFTSATAFGT
jgi:hypothetical protein